MRHVCFLFHANVWVWIKTQRPWSQSESWMFHIWMNLKRNVQDSNQKPRLFFLSAEKGNVRLSSRLIDVTDLRLFISGLKPHQRERSLNWSWGSSPPPPLGGRSFLMADSPEDTWERMYCGVLTNLFQCDVQVIVAPPPCSPPTGAAGRGLFHRREKTVKLY